MEKGKLLKFRTKEDINRIQEEIKLSDEKLFMQLLVDFYERTLIGVNIMDNKKRNEILRENNRCMEQLYPDTRFGFLTDEEKREIRAKISAPLGRQWNDIMNIERPTRFIIKKEEG